MSSARLRVGFLRSAGALLMLSAGAHAFGGWSPLRDAVIAAETPADVVGALAAGWYFGSVAMLAMGLIVLWCAGQLSRGNAAARFPLLVIAFAYVIFGAAAFVLRDYHVHFLYFVATGLLLGLPALKHSSS